MTTKNKEITLLRKQLDKAHQDIEQLQHEVIIERSQSRVRHQRIVEDLVKALRVRELSVLALKQVESFCKDTNVDASVFLAFQVIDILS